ncbi:MAG TPA: hypothetical protein VG479_02700 [Gaiellaceae bacterium]|nr:hypothetical protein [Gaiellaceae bacterium]
MADELYAVIAVGETLEHEEAERIARASREYDGLPLDAQQAGRKGPWLLEMPGVQNLLEESSWEDAVSWILTPDGVERLARTFEWLFEEIPTEFTFEVLWGDEPIDKLVSREELLRLVRTGHLGGRTRYRVMPVH